MMIAQLPPSETSALRFDQPVWIWVGVAVCIGIVALFVRFDRRRETDLAKIVHPRFRQRLTGGFSKRLRNTKRVIWLLAILLTFVAVARPQKGYEWREVKRKGIDILFAVDTSRSMLAEDLKPNRLERARLGILDFVERLEGDRIGLIPFAGSAFALCPLTLDYGAFRESLNALDTDLIPRQGTDLASAIKEAERLFEENGNNFRVLVLLTDGEDLQGSVSDAAKAAEEKGMSIYTVGVGSQEGARIPIGRNDFVRDSQGQIVTTTLDEATLKKIAEVTGGLYVPLGRGAEGLDTIYREKLRLVPKRELKQRLERVPLERFEWPLGAAIILLFLDFMISDRKRERKQRSLPSVARRVKASEAVSAIAIFAAMIANTRAAENTSVLNDTRHIYNQGTEEYSKGEFEKATETLRKSLNTPDLKIQQRSYYNLGNSLYRQGQTTLEDDPEGTIKTWDASVKAYEDALALDPEDEDAEFNKKLVEKKLEELKKGKDDKKQDDKTQDKKEGEDKEKDQSDQQDKKDGGDDGEKGEEQKDQKDGEGDEEKQDQKDQQGEGEDGKESKDGEDQKDDKKQGEEGREDPSDKEKDGEPGDEKKDGEPDKKDSEGKPSEKTDEKPGEEKQGNPQSGKEGEQQEKGEQAQAGEASEERGEKQEMSKEQAAQLLQALQGDEKNVIPIPQQRPSRYLTPANSTKGKTW